VLQRCTAAGGGVLDIPLDSGKLLLWSAVTGRADAAPLDPGRPNGRGSVSVLNRYRPGPGRPRVPRCWRGPGGGRLFPEWGLGGIVGGDLIRVAGAADRQQSRRRGDFPPLGDRCQLAAGRTLELFIVAAAVPVPAVVLSL
jgi:hypothetical protein